MARTPKAAPSPPVPARRGRKPKEAEPIESASAEEGDAEDAEIVEAEAAIVAPVEKPARGKPGPKPKRRPELALPALPDADEQPAMDLGQLDAAMELTLDQGDAMVAEMPDPVSADDGGAATSSDAVVGDVPLAASHAGPDQAKPAARWDRAADTVQFDWPAIERTAAQDGPNQVMAKLLVAARAEGANSRWPL